MGNDGSGWSMSVWPRYVNRDGQDSNKTQKKKRGISSGRIIINQSKVRSEPSIAKDGSKLIPKRKLNPDAFEKALIAAIGVKAAKVYIGKKKRENK